jgi:hypothetical protein
VDLVAADRSLVHVCELASLVAAEAEPPDGVPDLTDVVGADVVAEPGASEVDARQLRWAFREVLDDVELVDRVDLVEIDV